MVISTVLVSSPNEPDYNGALFLTALPGLLRHSDGYISCCSKSSYQPNFFSIIKPFTARSDLLPAQYDFLVWSSQTWY